MYMTEGIHAPDNCPGAQPRRLETIPLTDIIEGDRRRQDYGDLDELCDSIRKHGVLQSLIVCGTEPPYLLYAGGRRYQACKKLGLEVVPAHIFTNVPTDYELRCVELEENVQRKDLSWDERARMVSEIHDLELKLKGPKLSTAQNAPGHSVRDTAKILKDSPATISQDLKLAQAMKNLPHLDWSSCKNRNDALKMLKGMAKTLDHNVRAAEFTASLNSTSLVGQETLTKLTPAESANLRSRQFLADAYIIEDCFKALEKLQVGSFHLAEVDPPYAIDLVKSKKSGSSSLDSYNEAAVDVYPEFLNRLFKGLYRVMAADSYVLVWFSMEPWFDTVYQLLLSNGFKTSRNCAIWIKNYGATNSPDTTLASCYDSFFYARKGNPKLNRAGHSNTFIHNALAAQSKYHPTQRPDALLADMLTTFAAPGSRVLVPFAGSGVTLKEAVRAKMTPIGYDLSRDYRNAYLASLEDFSL